MQDDADKIRSPESDAARDLLLDLELRAAAGEPADFLELCARRPELEIELRALRDSVERPQFPQRPEALSLAARLQQYFGQHYAPRATLNPDGAPQGSVADSNRYAVLEEIGRGGMGVVFKVWDSDLRRTLAVKVSRARPFRSQQKSLREKQRMARFLDEAQITGQLEHPGIVPVHDVGIDEEGRVYFTMRYIRGRNLKEVFERAWSGDPQTPVARVIEVLIALCDTLEYAHDKGVVHRDLKPSNVMVGRFGAVYLMDWGVARVVDELKRPARPVRKESGVVEVLTTRRNKHGSTSESSLLTEDGDVVGTLAYMSPEQAKGSVNELSTRSDLYGLGAMLYHFLARHPPYSDVDEVGDATSQLLRVVAGPPKPLFEINPRLDPELVAICERAMQRDPKQRYQSASELGQELRAYTSGHVVLAFERGAWAELRKWVGRNRAFAATTAALLVLLAGAPIVVDRMTAAAAAEAGRLSGLVASYRIHMGAVLQDAPDDDSAKSLDAALSELESIAQEEPQWAIDLGRASLDLFRATGRVAESVLIAERVVDIAGRSDHGPASTQHELQSQLCALYNLSRRFDDAAQLARQTISNLQHAGNRELEQRFRIHLMAALIASPSLGEEALHEIDQDRDLFRAAVATEGALGGVEAFAGFLARRGASDEIEQIVADLRELRGLEATFEVRKWLVLCVGRDDPGEARALMGEIVDDMQRVLPPTDMRLARARADFASLLESGDELEASQTQWEASMRGAFPSRPILGSQSGSVVELDADRIGVALGAIKAAMRFKSWKRVAEWAAALENASCQDGELDRTRQDVVKAARGALRGAGLSGD